MLGGEGGGGGPIIKEGPTLGCTLPQTNMEADKHPRFQGDLPLQDSSGG